MNLRTDLGTLARAVGGRLMKGSPRAAFSSFVTDTRKLKPGEFFWALKGAAHDAHDFLRDAASCASGFLAREEQLARLPELPAAAVGVRDTLKALQDLAAWHRRRFPLKLAAVTGSNGKSTTKEMIKSIFSLAGAACSNSGNLNNQYGLPLSLLELGPEHEFAVFELGASHRGDIKEIASLAAPDCGVITNIGPAHLQFFGDLETVFETKTELVPCLAEGGTLVYNYDDQYLSRLNGRDIRKLTFGRDPGADVRILESAHLRLEYSGDIFDVRLPHAGGHNFYNAAAAAAAALACGLDFSVIRKGLESYTPPPMRLQQLRIKDALVILDAYNSNPHSAASALKHVAELPKPFYVMMGDMKELGEHSRKYHEELGIALAHSSAKKVFLAGPEMKAAADSFAKAGGKGLVYAEELDAWLPKARELIVSGEGTFLIKASRSMKFERIVEGLK